jgi:hypothetical protein
MLAPAPRPWWAPRAAAHSSASHPAVYSPLQVAAGWLPFLDYSPATERLLRLLHAGVGVAILGGGNWAVLLGLARYRHLTGARLLVRPPLLHRHLTGQSLQPHRLCTLERGARVPALFPSCIPKPSAAGKWRAVPQEEGGRPGAGKAGGGPSRGHVELLGGRRGRGGRSGKVAFGWLSAPAPTVSRPHLLLPCCSRWWWGRGPPCASWRSCMSWRAWEPAAARGAPAPASPPGMPRGTCGRGCPPRWRGPSNSRWAARKRDSLSQAACDAENIGLSGEALRSSERAALGRSVKSQKAIAGVHELHQNSPTCDHEACKSHVKAAHRFRALCS